MSKREERKEKRAWLSSWVWKHKYLWAQTKVYVRRNMKKKNKTWYHIMIIIFKAK
jgi:hypothetical protein